MSATGSLSKASDLVGRSGGRPSLTSSKDSHRAGRPSLTSSRESLNSPRRSSNAGDKTLVSSRRSSQPDGNRHASKSKRRSSVDGVPRSMVDAAQRATDSPEGMPLRKMNTWHETTTPRTESTGKASDLPVARRRSNNDAVVGSRPDGRQSTFVSDQRRKSMKHSGSGLLRGSSLERSNKLEEPPISEAGLSGSEQGLEDADSEKEELQGVPIKKPQEKGTKKKTEITKEPLMVGPTVSLTHMSKVLNKLEIFKGFSMLALMSVESHLTEVSYKKGDCIYRAGEKQNWMGILYSGSASVNVVSEVAGEGDRIFQIATGECFGELALLGLREIRSSTVLAEADCEVYQLRSDDLWNSVHHFDQEHETLMSEISQWKAFLGSRFVANCHPEIAYQLRRSGTRRTLINREEIKLGSKASSKTANSIRGTTQETTAIVEFGSVRCVGTDTRDHFTAGSVVNEEGVLGVNRAMTVTPVGESCGLVILTRQDFWQIATKLQQDKDNFTKHAMTLLPPSTVDLSACEVLAYLQGTPHFWRVLQNFTRQRTCYPGEEICKADTPCEVLRFLQTGTAECVIQGHRIYVESAGGCCGELNLIGIHAQCATTVRALDLCVVQEISRTHLEQQFSRHPAVRNRFRELTKLKPHFKQECTSDAYVTHLQEILFFSEMSTEFLKDVITKLEDRIYLAKQVIASDASKATSGSFLTVILEGTCIQSFEGGEEQFLGPGTTAGEVSLLCNISEDDGYKKETLTAETVCCVHKLHRVLLFDSLKNFPNEKRHFESIARDHVSKLAKIKGTNKGNNDDEQHYNIYTLPFFKTCGSRFLYLLDLHLERHLFFSDEMIVKEGTDGEEMYIIYSGSADALVKGTKVGELNGGSCFGEMAVLGLVKTRTASIVATMLCDIRILSRRALEDALKDYPDQRERFESLAATRHRISQEKQFGGKITQTSRFFQGCREKYAAALTNCMEDKLYMKGQVVMKERDTGDWMLLLHEGQCDVSIKGEVIATLTGGDIAGEMALMGISQVRTATITAASVCFVQILHRSDMLPVLEQFPEEKAAIRLRAAKRLQTAWAAHHLDAFKVLKFCQNAPRAFIDFIDKKTNRYVYFKDDMLVKENTRGDYLLLIMSGQLSVMRDNDVIGEVGAGEVIGELSTMGFTEERTATVVCKEITDVYALHKNDLREALKLWPEQEPLLRSVAAVRLHRDVARAANENFLSKCSLFAQCSSKFIECISRHLEDRIYMPGEHLCEQGEEGDTMFVLMQGKVDCVVSGTKVSELSKGGTVGEIAVLGLSSVRTATLRAAAVCLVQVLHRPIFMKYLAEFPREMIQFQEAGVARLANVAVTVNSHIFYQQALFKSCCPEFIEALRGRLHRTFFFANQKIVKEGSESNEMYGILQGRATVERRNMVIGEIEAGLCFGEMAVLGIAKTQTLTVKAETLCDMHVLSRWDLEELFKQFPSERKILLDVVAKMMREDLSEVTNVEILSEVNCFNDVDTGMIECLAEEVTVGLCRKDEFVAEVGEVVFFVLLQGSANVEVNGTAIREIAEGDSFGFCNLVQARELNNVAVRALTSCLTLRVEGDAFAKTLAKFPTSYAHFHGLAAKFRKSTADMGQAALANAPIISNCKLQGWQLEQLLQYCEEIVHSADDQVMASAARQSNITFVIGGQASIEDGIGRITLEHGCCVGDLSDEAGRATDPPILATTVCKVLVLQRRAFLAWVNTESASESSRILATFETIRRETGNTSKHSSGSVIRERAEKMAAELVNTVKSSLKKRWARNSHKQNKVVGKGWQNARAVLSLNKIMPMRSALDALKKDEADDDHMAAKIPSSPKNRLQLQFSEQDSSEQCKNLRVPSKSKTNAPAVAQLKVRKIKVQGHERDLERQERLMCEEMLRLTATAKYVAVAARKDEARLRSDAVALRSRLTALQDAADFGRPVHFGHDGSAFSGMAELKDQIKPHYGTEPQRIQSHCDASERRIRDLQDKLEQAEALQKSLLARLRVGATASF